MRYHGAIVVLLGLAIGVSAFAVQPSGSSSSERATTSPTTRPVTARLVGTYNGTVMDDDQIVPCRTVFTFYNGVLIGKYFVREGRDQYEGTLSEFKLLSDERGECRFRWKDKHGTGVLTISVTDDGSTFAGSWGLEVIQEELVWTGLRDQATTRSTGPRSLPSPN